MPKLLVDHTRAMVDMPIHIQVVGLDPNQEVLIRLRRKSFAYDQIFHLESHAIFRAGNNGVVDLSSQYPIAGNYDTVDGMGLFWSLDLIETELNTSGELGSPLPLDPHIATLTLEIEGEVFDRTEIARLWKADNVVRTPIRDNGLIATFFHKDDGVPRPGIIAFGGSEGGLNEYVASVLAAHGYSTLALAYFGVEHLPKNLVNVPLEYMKTAIDWMLSRPEVKKGWLGIHGTSRGGELALLTASLFPEIRAAVSLNGSAIAFHGLMPADEYEVPPPAWTYQGAPIPYASQVKPVDLIVQHREMRQKGQFVDYRDWYNFHVSDPEVMMNALIPVERIHGSVLFITPDPDSWDSVRYCSLAMERLKNAKHPYHYEQLIYPRAGHATGIPYTRVVVNPANGATVKDTAKASVESWNKTLQFFDQSVKHDSDKI